MSDTQQRFINIYVDKAVGMLHEYLATIIQLRTQLQLANDLLQEKEQVINSFNSNSEKVETESKNLSEELESAKNNSRHLEEQYNAMKSKIAHMDNLTNQLNEMKQGLIAKNEEVVSVNNKLKEAQDEIVRLNNIIEEESSKKVINTKTAKPTPMKKKVEEVTETNDDF